MVKEPELVVLLIVLLNGKAGHVTKRQDAIASVDKPGELIGNFNDLPVQRNLAGAARSTRHKRCKSSLRGQIARDVVI